MKSICIWSFSAPYFPAFRLNTETIFTQRVIELFHTNDVKLIQRILWMENC